MVRKAGEEGSLVVCPSASAEAREFPGPPSPRGSSSRADGVICPAFVAWAGQGGGGDGPSDGCESDRLLLFRFADGMDSATPGFVWFFRD